MNTRSRKSRRNSRTKARALGYDESLARQAEAASEGMREYRSALRRLGVVGSPPGPASARSARLRRAASLRPTWPSGPAARTVAAAARRARAAMLNDIMRIAINLGPSRRGLNVLCRVHATLAEAEDIGLTKPTKPAEARRIDSIAGKVCRTCGFGIKDHPKGDCPSGGSWRPPHCH